MKLDKTHSKRLGCMFILIVFDWFRVGYFTYNQWIREYQKPLNWFFSTVNDMYRFQIVIFGFILEFKK